MRNRALFVWASLFAAGCGSPDLIDLNAGEIPFNPERPELPAAPRVVAPYAGADALVAEAQLRYVTGLDVHRKVVMRSCGGSNGVCHNQKEYPDLHTPASFAAAIDAPCNVQPGSFESVFDRCERPGDRFRLTQEGRNIEVAWIQNVPGVSTDFETDSSARPDGNSAGLHVFLAEPIDIQAGERWGPGIFTRTFVDGSGNIGELPFIKFETQWWVLPDRRHLFAEVPEWKDEERENLLRSGIVQGDANRNGILGYRAGRFVTLLNPGKPEESYLVGRLRGRMQGEDIPGTRMPLANQPPSIPDMLGIMCFIEQLDPARSTYNLEDGIDYNACSYSANPSALSLVGQGITFSARIAPLLAANCGGCHGGTTPSAGLDLATPEGLFDRLTANSTQQSGRKLVAPGQPQNSYLFLKLTGDGSITGTRMPQDRQLTEQELGDVETWILAGALND